MLVLGITDISWSDRNGKSQLLIKQLTQVIT
jgi:hypothetical protein